MSSYKKTIEDAVVALLNNPSISPPFSKAFTAERGPIIIRTIKDLETLRVVVNFDVQREKRETRGKVGMQGQVQIGITWKVGFEGTDDTGRLDPTNVEAMYFLTDEIAFFMLTMLESSGLDFEGPLDPDRDYCADDGLLGMGGMATTVVADTTIWFPRDVRPT